MSMKIPFAILGLAMVAMLMGMTGYAPKTVTKYTATKSLTYNARGKKAITFQCSTTASMYINGRGQDWPVPARVPQDLLIFGNVSTVKFTHVSSANKATYRFQEH